MKKSGNLTIKQRDWSTKFLNENIWNKHTCKLNELEKNITGYLSGNHVG